MRALRVLVPAALLVFAAVAVGSGSSAQSSAVRCAGSAATIVGTGGADRLVGTARADVIAGRGGGDTISGRGGNDKICDGGGNDRVVAGGGNDLVKGGGGRDRVTGGGGRDNLSGGGGTDTVAGGGGNDRVSGNAGDDALRGNGGADRLNGGGGTDNCLGGPGADTIQNCETGDVTPPAPGDQAPVAVADAQTVGEDASAQPIDVLANDTDSDGGPRSVGSVTQPANGTVTITGGGSGLSYQPAANYCNSGGAATDNFSYALTPGSSSAQVAVTVTCLNDKPSITTVAGPRGYPEGAGKRTLDPSLTVADVDSGNLSGASVRITAGFDETEGDTLELPPQSAITGTYDTGVLTLTGTASVSDYQAALRAVTFETNAPETSATRTVAFDATDAETPPLTSDPATVDIDIQGANTPPDVVTQDPVAAEYTENGAPIPVDDQVTVNDPHLIAGATVSITTGFAAGEDVLEWSDNNAGDAITLDPSSSAQTLVLTGTDSAAAYQAALRAVTYRNASDSFAGTSRTVTFSVTDELGETGSDTRNVNVNAVDDPAVAQDDSATVSEDDPATSVPVLANDTELDDEPLTIANATQPANGTVVLTGGSIGSHTGLTYEPDDDYCNTEPLQAADTFTYTLNSGDTATVSMTVTCVNDPAVAADDAFTGNDSAHGNTTMVVNDPDDAAPAPSRPKTTVSGDILANDSDPEGGSLSVAPGTLATNDGGSVTIESDGDFTFEPAAATSCTDSSDFFDYTVTDGAPGGTDTGRVTIAIAGCVWYVSNNAAGNSGTSAAPFDTLAQAESASGAGHTVFVFDGDDTSTGYDSGYAMASGERLIGEHEGLRVDQDGGGALTEDTLHPANPGARPTLTAANEDVVDLDDANELRGFVIDPAGTGGGIAGGPGDTGGGTIDDVQVTDTAAAGEQPGLELSGTSGTFNVSDLAVDNSATSAPPGTARGVLLNNAGTVNFAEASAVTLNTKGATALQATDTNMGSGSVFDSITVTNTSSGAVSLVNTTGTTQLGDGVGTDLSLATTSGNAAALRIESAGNVSVPAAGTANVTATGGPAVQVVGTAGASLALALDDVDSTNSSSDGISLSDLRASDSFSAASGDIGGAAGNAFYVSGGSGTISYPGNLNNGSGATATIQARTGGTVTLSGQVGDTSDPGGGINLAGNSGGSTSFSNATKTLNTGASNALSMTSSDGHTLNLTGGGLDIDTTSGTGLQALTSGTLMVTGSGNTIDTGTGRALNVSNTDVHPSAPLTFQRIASNGAANGIVLSATGTNPALTVTGAGGTCTNANTSGCSGGMIANSTGADDASAVPSGAGIALNATRGVSLTRMLIQNHSNYGIRGTDVAGFTLNDSVINGTNGTSGVNDDSSVYFDNASGPALTGSASIARTHIQGGFENNFWVSQTSGSLNRITFDTVTIGPNSTTGGNAGIMLEGLGTATTNATVTGSTFTSTRGSHFQMIAGGSGGGDLDFFNNAFSNNHPAVGTGGGGIVLQGGSGGGTFDINVNGSNTIRDSLGHAFIVEKNIGSGSITGAINGLTVGVSGVANSGSLEGDGLKVEHEGQGTLTLAVTNNTIRQYNNFGMELKAGDGIAQGGTMNLSVSNNLVTQPGSNAAISNPFQGIALNNGVTPGDSFQTCLDLEGNGVLGSGRNLGDDIRVRARQSTNVRLPGYSGSPTDTTAIATFLRNQNTANGVPTASAALVDSATFSGTGTTCP